MEIFMRNISYSVTSHEVKSELAIILHTPRYASSPSSLSLNFDVRLFKDRRGTRNHSGNGALTLPSSEVGILFLEVYGELLPRNVCYVGGRAIKFTQSRNSARADILEYVQQRPYIEPGASEERKRIEAILASGRVSVKTIQFGWECRDNVFSIEWEETFEKAFLFFDDERREIRIELPQHLSDSLIIAVRLSQISYTSAHIYLSEEPVIFLTLELPPAFEKGTSPQRRRLAALPIADHALVAPYTSLAMRLVCTSQQDLQKFRQLSNVARLHGIYDLEYAIGRRGLFSAAAIDEYQTHLRRCNWCVAYQLESLVRHMYVDIKEILGLMPRIVRLVKEKGKEYTSSMLRHFGTRARSFFWAPDEAEERTIAECFTLAEVDFAAANRSPKLQPTDESLFESLHVIITPTTMFLEGPFQERSNRVIRRYDPVHHESFLRVSFVDEGRLQYRFDRDIDGPAFIRSRVGELLLNGLTIARRTFRFLAYSQSALKEHAVWCVWYSFPVMYLTCP
jgi:RNA-dependent RNA polymerase